MTNKVNYHILENFTYHGVLGISYDVIEEIVKKAVEDIKGASLLVTHSIFAKQPINVKFKKNNSLFIDVSIVVEYGYNVNDVCLAVQDKIERNIMYLVEIKPRKVDVTVANIKAKNDL